MINYSLSEETLGYTTNPDPSNTDIRFLVSGSKNVFIDWQKKVKIRSGYSRLGAENTALTHVRNAWTWNTSLGQKLPQRFYDDELEVYLGTIDTYEINAWTRVAASWSTTKRMRRTTWYDATEKMDVQLMVVGDDKIYEWSGGVAVVSAVTANTITKKGTTTFAQNHFYADAGSTRTLINVRTGTEFSYTGGESTTTLTGVTGSPVTDGMIEGDILIQKVVTNDNKPADKYLNDFIYNFENQIVIGSENDSLVYISANDDYTDYTPSAPRIAGEGLSITLDGTCRGITSLGKYLLIGAGKSSIFKAEYTQITVGTTLTESVQIKKLDVGVNQGFLNQESIVQIGNAIAYLTNEVALRIIESPDNLVGINPKTFSNPIKPDFDAEDWWDSSGNADVFGIWYKNMLIYALPQASHMYMLNFAEDADGKTWRFWNPPQVLPVGPMSLIDLDDGNGEKLYGHSNSVPETYLLFDGASDAVYSGMAVADKIPIDAKAVFAYNNYKKRGVLKNFDEYYVEGEITPNTTDLVLQISYDYDGQTQKLYKTIDGSDEDILEGNIGFNSLAQQSLAVNPLGGLLNSPTDARRFRVAFEIAKEDFYEMQVTFSTNECDRYWAILSHGANARLSNRKDYLIKK
jgi:hypothetical protein